MTPYRVQEIKLSLVRSKRRTFQVHDSADVADAFKDLAKGVRECIFAVYLNGANKIIGFERVSTGTISTAHAEPAEVLRTALILGARGLIVIHNHPGGLTCPSENDHEVTRRISQTAKLFNVRLLDHIIIGADEAHYSFADSGMLPSDEIVPLYTAGKKGRPKLKARVLTRTH